MGVTALKTEHPVPLEALNLHAVILGNSGSGKSYAARGMVETLHAAGRRQIIIDPTGVWWGIQSSADGRKSGLPLPIFGGDHANVPISDTSGRKLGAFLAERSLSCVLDISDFSNAGMRRFMNGFLDALWMGNKRPLHLIVDEADWFAPQNPVTEKGEGSATLLLGHMSKIVRRGRVRGFRVMLITQRPATIHKDVLTQVSTLIAKFTIAPQDRAAVESWVKGQADVEAGKEVLGTLAKLEEPEGWVWAPKLDFLKRVKFPRIRTFDSMRAPVEGENFEPETMADIDLGELADAFGEEVSETEADAKGPKVDLDAIRRSARDEGRREGFSDGLAAGLRQAVEAVEAIRRGEAAQLEKAAPEPAVSRPEPSRSDVLGRHQRVLEGLGFWRDLGFETPTRKQVAVASSYSPKSSGFEKTLSEMRTARLIDMPSAGCLSLTELGERSRPATLGGSVRERLAKVLSERHARVLDALPKNGDPMSRAQLAAASDYSTASSGYEKTLSELRSLGLIDMPKSGHVAVEPWVWR